jgi:hypothetical protein
MTVVDDKISTSIEVEDEKLILERLSITLKFLRLKVEYLES